MKVIHLLLVKPVSRIFHFVAGDPGIVQNRIDTDIRMILAEVIQIIFRQAAAIQAVLCRSCCYSTQFSGAIFKIEFVFAIISECYYCCGYYPIGCTIFEAGTS